MNLISAMCFVAVVSVAVAATGQTLPSWQSRPEGQLILRTFAHAPYPHASRADGWKYKETIFPRDPHYVDSTVGVFIPAGYKAGESVDYIVHFHGWSNHVSKVIEQYKLLPQLVAAKKNAILLVPQGPKDAQDSGGGKLELDEGAFAQLIAEVTQFLNDEGKIHTSKVGHIALTAHSGGYKVAAAILHLGGMNQHINDVLLLDASYGSLEWFADWCKADPSHRLVSLFTDHLEKENRELMGLLKAANVNYELLDEGKATDDELARRGAIFMHTKGPHDLVPNDYFGKLVHTSSLSNLPAP